MIGVGSDNQKPIDWSDWTTIYFAIIRHRLESGFIHTQRQTQKPESIKKAQNRTLLCYTVTIWCTMRPMNISELCGRMTINDKSELGEVVAGTASFKTEWVLVGSRGRRCREGGRACWPLWTAPVLFFRIWKIGSDWWPLLQKFWIPPFHWRSSVAIWRRSKK